MLVILAALLGGSWDLVTTYKWPYNHAHNWDNLHNKARQEDSKCGCKPSYKKLLSPMSLHVL